MVSTKSHSGETIERGGMTDAGARTEWHHVRKAWLIVAVLAGVTFAGSLLVGNWLFPRLSANNDEPVYVLEAQTIESGHLTLSASAHDDFFRPWMSGRTGNDRLVLVEQPVLPSLLAASDLVFGSMRVGLGLVAAGAVVAIFGATRELLRDERVAIVAAAVFVASPLVIVQSALFLSYLLAVLLTCVVITLVAQSSRSAGRGRLVAAGLALGLLFFTRPIESLMLGGCLVIWMAASGRRSREVVRDLTVAGLGATPVLLTCLAYNVATTGNPLRFPLWAIGGNDAFGFGTRAIVDGSPQVRFGVGEAWLALRTNLRAFPHWVAGGLAMLPLAAWGGVCIWRVHRRVLVLLVSIAVIYPIGYFFYYGNYLIISGRRFFGPHYYLVLLIPATILVATALVDLVSRRVVLVAVVVPLLVVGTALEAGDKIRVNTEVRDGIAREVDAVRREVRAPAVVIVPAGIDGAYVLHPRGQFANKPDLSDATLYAADLQGRDNELFDRFPDRAIYRLQIINDGFGGHPDVRQLTRVRHTGFDITVTISPPAGRSAVSADVSVDGETTACTIASRADGRPLVADAHLTPNAIRLSGCAGGDVTVPLPDGPVTVAVGASDGPDTSGPVEHVEQRYWIWSRDQGLDLITPADTWRTSGDAPIGVIDPQTLTWAHFDLVQPSP